MTVYKSYYGFEIQSMDYESQNYLLILSDDFWIYFNFLNFHSVSKEKL